MPISDTDLLWKEEWINGCLDRDFTSMPTLVKGSIFTGMNRYMGVDLSIAEAVKEGSFFVIVVIGVDEAYDRWLLWVERHRGLTFGQQADLVIDVHKRLQPHATAVESVGYQKSLQQHLAQYSDVAPQAFYTSDASKRDLEVGIPSMATEFEHRRWHLPWADAKSRSMVEPFIDELRMYGLQHHGFHTDIIMASYFAREASRNQAIVEPKIHAIRF